MQEEADERNAQRSPSNLDAIYSKWKCEGKECKNYEKGYCYIHETKHVEFDLVDANAWDRSIKKEEATVDAPTSAIIMSMMKKNHRLIAIQSTSRRSVVPASPSFNTTNHTHFYFGDIKKMQQQAQDQAKDPELTQASSLSHPTTPGSGANYGRNPLPSSPIVAESDAEEELERYFDCLMKKEKGGSVKRMLTNAKEKLLENGIKISQIRKLRDDQMDKMEITEIGIQMTIREGVREFKAEMKKSQTVEL